MSNQTINPYNHIQILPNTNGTYTRLHDGFPRTSPSSDTTLPISVLTKDLTINHSNNTWLRLFLPRTTLSSSNHNHKKKLPLIVFFHGSGFVRLSAASTIFHDFCVQMADSVEAVVASVDYRLAPEHRLPAAYDDAMEALCWIGRSKDEWLTRYADFSTCYLMGDSAGATIAYRVGLRAVEEVKDLEALKIQGLILRQPFFGGIQRTESELRLENNPHLPLCVSDLMWELALPIGANRDHEYCSLRAENGIDKMRELGWRVLVSGNGGDPLVDRDMELVLFLKEKGLNVVSDFEDEGYHGIEHFDPSKATKLIGVVKTFVSSVGA